MAETSRFNNRQRGPQPGNHFPSLDDGRESLKSVFLMVFACLTLSVFSTIEQYEEVAANILTYMESFVVVWFTIEFALRLWSSGCRSRYQGYMGRLKFLRRPFCIIDVITIVASIVVLVMRSRGQVLATSALRGLRFFQILRMVRMDRRGGTWKLLGSVVYAHRQELITTLYIGFLGLIFASFLVFLAEKDVNKKFSNFAQALWWGVITLCTVGYGDMVPETWQGKIIASFCALLGISFFALPAGILGSGFALKVQQQQRQKHMIRRRQPAATLIQSLWRCYAADELSMSVATWKIHQLPLPSPPSRVSSSFRHNTSFVSRLPTIRRHKSTSLHSPSIHKGATRAGRPFRDINASVDNLGVVPYLGIVRKPVKSNGIIEANSNLTAEGCHISNCPHLCRNYHGSSNGTRTTNFSHSEDSVAETALSKRNSDDEEEEPRCIQLTEKHKRAIRAIRKLKYFVARKKFREALKPYDVKDVIEQYSSGHADLLNRVKNLQFRLDQILGKQGSQAMDVYDSDVCLASRVVKMERQVDELDEKVTGFINLYMEDRKRLQALPYDPQASTSDQPSPVLPAPSTSSTSLSVLKPKPILIDKQSSEPNSPITKSMEESASITRKPMHRGYSDLGNRIKKRVTLSSAYDGEVVIVVPSLNRAPPPSTEIAASGSIATSDLHDIQDSPRTTTEESSGIEDCPKEEDDEDLEDPDITETTLLCPNRSTEILISPTTLRSTTDDYSESIGLTQLKSDNKNMREEV